MYKLCAVHFKFYDGLLDNKLYDFSPSFKLFESTIEELWAKEVKKFSTTLKGKQAGGLSVAP